VGTSVFDGFVGSDVGKLRSIAKLVAFVVVVLASVVAADVAAPSGIIVVVALVTAVIVVAVLGMVVPVLLATVVATDVAAPSISTVVFGTVVASVIVASRLGVPIEFDDDAPIGLFEGISVASLFGDPVGEVDTPMGLIEGISVASLFGDPVGEVDTPMGLIEGFKVADLVESAEGVVVIPSLGDSVGLGGCGWGGMGMSVGVVDVVSLVGHSGSGPHVVLDFQLHIFKTVSKIRSSEQLIF